MQHKRRVAIAAENFNRKPTKSSTFEHLQAAGFLPATLDGASIAHFLLTTPGLDRTAVGVYLGEPEELPLATLKALPQKKQKKNRRKQKEGKIVASCRTCVFLLCFVCVLKTIEMLLQSLKTLL
jgi:hypothetical protein